jgi:hypothetical protein
MLKGRGVKMDCYLTDECYWTDYKYPIGSSVPHEICQECVKECRESELQKKLEVAKAKQ